MRRLVAGKFATVALAIVLFAALGSVARACPTCGEALGHQDAAHNGVAKGFYYSILFMMGMPYLVLATFCGCMYWKVRRARAARALQAKGVENPSATNRIAANAHAAAPAVRRIETREPVKV
jgi:uncharacterized membrane protein